MKKTNGRKSRTEVVQMFEGESQFIIPRKGAPADVPVDVISTGERALNATDISDVNGVYDGSNNTEAISQIDNSDGSGSGGGSTEPVVTTDQPAPTEPATPTAPTYTQPPVVVIDVPAAQLTTGAPYVQPNGNASYCPYGGQLSWLWQFVSGPNTPTLSASTGPTPVIQNFVAGTYTFRARATSNVSVLSTIQDVTFTVAQATPALSSDYPYKGVNLSGYDCAQITAAISEMESFSTVGLTSEAQAGLAAKLNEAYSVKSDACSTAPPQPACNTTFPYQGTTMSMLNCAQLTEAVTALQAVDRSALCAPQVQMEYDQKLAEAQQWMADKCSYTPPPPPDTTEEPVVTEPTPPPPPSCSTTFPYQGTTMSMLSCAQLTEAVAALQAVDRSALCAPQQAEYDQKLAEAQQWQTDKCSYTPPPPPPVVEEPVVTEPPAEEEPVTTEPPPATEPVVTEPVVTSPSQTTFPYKSTTMSMLNCVQLNEAVDTLQAFNTAVLTPEAKTAYDVKLAEAKEWQKNKFCLTSPVNIGGQVAIPVIPISPIVGSAMGGMGAGAGGGGGDEEGVLIEEPKKDFNWWWLLVVAGAVVYYVSSDKKK